MLKEFKGLNLILIIYCILLYDNLTYSTIGFVLFSLTLTGFEIRLPSHFRSAIAIIVFSTYYFIYGKVIDPEVGLNFLVSVLSLKILEEENRRDKFMILFGFLLLIGSGSLFEKTLPYALYLIFSLIYIVKILYKINSSIFRLNTGLKFFFFILPLTFFIFMLAPRMSEISSFNPTVKTPGAIVGYTPDVKISEVESLQLSSKKMFDAKLSKKINQEELYWRGNVLDFNDGWNWFDRHRIEKIKLLEQTDLVKQDIYLHEFHDYYIALDKTQAISGENNISNAQTLRQLRNRFNPRYTAFSSQQSDSALRRIEKKNFLHSEETDLILKLFPETDLILLINKVKDYFQKNGFTYSFNPGKIFSIRHFLIEKKMGFCSHYASTLALILRTHGHPSRLVSGYLGGKLNQYGQFYEVTQNDAHVWVEYYQDGSWHRIDPTVWIAPGRLELGGEVFSQSMNTAKSNIFLRYLSKYQSQFNEWISQWNYDFYFWLDGFDYQFQINLIKKWSIERKQLFSVIIIIITFFVLLFYLHQLYELKFPKKKQSQKLWLLFSLQLRRQGLDVSNLNVLETETLLKNYPFVLELYREIVLCLYANKDYSFDLMKKRIKKIKKL